MSKFEVVVSQILDIFDHPMNDKLSVVKIFDYNCISSKLPNGSPRYTISDIVIYVPEGAIVPENLLRLGFWDSTKKEGILSGRDGNRVRAVKMDGIVSQGIIFSINDVKDFLGKETVLSIGDNVAELLNIKKYESPIPNNMTGETIPLDGKVMKYDIENLKKYPNIFRENEPVSVTESIHGVFFGVCFYPSLNNKDVFFNGEVFCYSKKLAEKSLVFKNTKQNKDNVYVKSLLSMFENGIFDQLSKDFDKPVYLMMEIFGRNIQDLSYGINDFTYRLFDVYTKENESFLSVEELKKFCQKYEIEMVPNIYKGPFYKHLMDDLKEGKTTFDVDQVREGIVIKPLIDRYDEKIGRVILKHVGDGFLTRSGRVTEFN